MTQLQQRLGELVERDGRSTYIISHLCGLSKNTVSKIIDGMIPKANTLARLADYFGVTTDYLLGR